MSHEDPGVQEREAGLPAPEELIPLTQTLIPPDLALAFKIIIEPDSDVPRFCDSSENMIAPPCPQAKILQSIKINGTHLLSPMQQNLGFSLLSDPASLPPINFFDCGLSGKALKLDANLWGSGAADQQQNRACMGYNDAHIAGFVSIDTKADNGMNGGADSSEGGSSKKLRKRLDTDFEDVESSVGLENSNEESAAARTLKRPRLVWTPQLHKRFVEAVAQLGIKNAVPKTIMQLMNVDGLTRENVASHLQKYRLYLKRMQGLSSDGPSVSDHLFASTPLLHSLSGSSHFLSGHGEDLVPFLMPVPMGSFGPTHMQAEKLSTPLSSMELNMYNSLIQPFPCQRMNQEYLFDGHAHPGSPKRQVLTLFPQNDT